MAMRRQRNDHFTFKQFHIDQTDCAMKVSSDACLLGASVPVAGARRILDIGTGTGLIALMVAQRVDPSVSIDAVELCSRAARTAQQNVAGSAFASQIQVYHQPIQQYVPPHGHSYDLIVANPPFFPKSSLLGKNRGRYLAWHADEQGLDFATLIAAVLRHLHASGLFWLLLPANQHEAFARLALGQGLHERGRVAICHKPDDHVNRVICALGRHPGPCICRHLVRCEADGSPSLAVRDLLKDYMLHF